MRMLCLVSSYWANSNMPPSSGQFMVVFLMYLMNWQTVMWGVTPLVSVHCSPQVLSSWLIFFNCGLDIWLLGPIKLGKNKWKQSLAGVLVTILLFLIWAESLTQKNRCTTDSTEHIFSGLLRGLHSTLGSPKNPSGHLHSGSCPTTLQKALMAQGSSKMQGSMHCLFLQLL